MNNMKNEDHEQWKEQDLWFSNHHLASRSSKKEIWLGKNFFLGKKKDIIFNEADKEVVKSCKI